MSDRTERKLYGPEYREWWGPGPWNDEPDEILWTDDDSGYKCAMRRNELGSWCGYVAVPSSHPAHGIHPGELGGQLRCHWGLTYSDFGDPRANPVEDGKVSDLWWFGFDCSHAYDLTPGSKNFWLSLSKPGQSSDPLTDVLKDLKTLMDDLKLPFGDCLTGPNAVYRDVAYVEEQINRLTQQLVACAILQEITPKTSDHD